MIHRWLLGVVAVLLIVAAAGMVLLWPSTPGEAESVEPLLDGVVRSAVEIACPEDPLVPVEPPCLQVEIEVVEGSGAGTTFEVDTGEQGFPPFSVGGRVKVGQAAAAEGDAPLYYVQDFARLGSLAWLFGLFVVVVLGVGRWHGLRSLAGLGDHPARRRRDRRAHARMARA